MGTMTELNDTSYTETVNASRGLIEQFYPGVLDVQVQGLPDLGSLMAIVQLGRSGLQKRSDLAESIKTDRV